MPVHDEVPFRKGQRVLVRQNWIRDHTDERKGNPCLRFSGKVLAVLPRYFADEDLGQSWTVVKWDDKDDPETFKTAGLEAGR